MLNNISMIDTIKNESVDNIVAFTKDMAKQCLQKYDDLFNVINDSNSIFEINVTSIGKDKILQSIILSLILITISSNLMNPYIKEEYQNKIINACKKLNLEYNDLLKIAQHERKLLEIMEF